ncbi:nucleotidyltransferase domain-containing protein [Paenibacillus chitinolyticus]|uniref:nucleotidyltransferase domain-containing protein n=1 Tax=Paenibacillus chitinolyticus TaxID=79263 RepID=UPI0035D74FF8
MRMAVAEVLSNPEQILKHLPDKNLSDAYVYISGSHMEGFGYEKSDIDVYVIYNNIPDFKTKNEDYSGESLLWEGTTLVRNLIYDDIRFDFEYWDKKEFNKAVHLLKTFNFSNDEEKFKISDAEIDLLHRLKYAKPISVIDEFMQFHSTIPFENLGYYQATIASERIASFIEDIQGALLSNDLGSSFFMVRRLVELSTVSYLAVHGETNPNLKWLYRKILRFQQNKGDNVLLENYLYFQTHPFNEKSVREFVKKAMRFAQELNMKTQKELQAKHIIKP